jgi:hypothetical protein
MVPQQPSGITLKSGLQGSYMKVSVMRIEKSAKE